MSIFESPKKTIAGAAHRREQRLLEHWDTLNEIEASARARARKGGAAPTLFDLKREVDEHPDSLKMWTSESDETLTTVLNAKGQPLGIVMIDPVDGDWTIFASAGW